RKIRRLSDFFFQMFVVLVREYGDDWLARAARAQMHAVLVPAADVPQFARPLPSLTAALVDYHCHDVISSQPSLVTRILNVARSPLLNFRQNRSMRSGFSPLAISRMCCSSRSGSAASLRST